MAKVVRVSGPVVEIESEGETPFLFEVVKVGSLKLLGEVVAIKGSRATVQVYERTEGLKVGDDAVLTGKLLSATLGPGILGTIMDGLGRVLSSIGERIERGTGKAFFPREKFDFTPSVKVGDEVEKGEILGTIKDKNFEYRIVSPYNGTVETVKRGKVKAEEPICKIGGKEVFIYEERLLRFPSKLGKRKEVESPLFTGQRIIDFLFPLAKGGTASIPGGFGTGKTVLQQTLAKWCNADVIVYIGCGERGNEMTEVLEEFPNLKDPYTGRNLMERTVLIANTSDMPVSARESSIYLGITVAEYFRDMGYSVAVMADSTSRWAEAMREISGRMGELPVEEGFPASLSYKLASIYERAGEVAFKDRKGSVTIIGAVSPPGGDFSEPVTRHTKKLTGTFWALDKELARARFYPAINPFNSYSRYADYLKRWWENYGNWKELREWMIKTLQEGAKLEKLVKLLGKESLPEEQKLKFEAYNLIREGFLRQNAFDPIDAFSSPKKQILMAETIRTLVNWWERVLKKRKIPVSALTSKSVVKAVLTMGREIGEEELSKIEKIKEEIEKTYGEFLN